MADAVALVAGATGLVGKALVAQLAVAGEWREVRALARRPLAPGAPKVVPVQVDYGALEPAPEWAAAEHVFCALGTTIKEAGSRETFRRVDFEYPLALARAARARGARHFLLVSALGASSASRVFYSRVKGDVEQAIVALGFRAVTIARPSLLVGERPEPRLGEQVGKVIGSVMPLKWRPIAAVRVAASLVEAARRDQAGIRIIENRELHAARV